MANNQNPGDTFGSRRSQPGTMADTDHGQDVYARVASAAASRPGAGPAAATPAETTGRGTAIADAGRSLGAKVSEKMGEAGRKLTGADDTPPTALLRSSSERRLDPAGSGRVPAVAAEIVEDDDRQRPGIRRTRKARLRLSRLDPWSVMKTAFMFSIAAGIVFVVAVYAIWTVVNSSGLFDNVNEIIASVVSTPGDTTPFRIEDYVNTAKVMGVTAFLAVIDVVIFTALLTLGSFLYNLAATMLGGLEVTLAED